MLCFSLIVFLLLFCPLIAPFDVNRVVSAINCGGDEFIDSYGIKYMADDLGIGVASAHGRQMAISRVPVSRDQELYQTERYHSDSFTYELPLTKQDANHVLWLKFSEVYFTSSLQKVFNVVLNHELTVIRDLDIYALVGKAAAHDEFVEFSVEDHGRTLVYKEKRYQLKTPGKLAVTFEKTDYDNPKINAIILVRNVRVEDLPTLSPINYPIDEDDDFDEDEFLTKPPHTERQHQSNSKPSVKLMDEGDPDEDDQEMELQSQINVTSISVIVAILVGLVSIAFLVQRI